MTTDATSVARKTPFHDPGLAAGAQMRELFGYWLPWQYSAGHEAEHLATRNRVSVCDLDYMAEFEIKGRDSLPFLQQLCTNDFAALTVGGVRYTTMCTDDGNMVDDGTVWHMDTDRFVFITGDEADHDWIAKQAEPYDVEVVNRTAEWTTLAVQGPRSRETLEALTDADLGSLRYYRFLRGTVAGVSCTIARMGYTGEYGFELHFHPDHGEAVWAAVMEAGAGHGIEPCGQAALESLRQEAGYLLVGNDHGKDTNPLEAGLGFTVKFAKESFNGRQALIDLLERGVGRQLVWLRVAGDGVTTQGAPVQTPGGRPIGAVTSASYSPTLGGGVALAYVAKEHAVPSVPLRIADGEMRAATVSIMPLYDPGDTRTR